jgi:cbb3-type cytochrome oxidase subunit 3
MEQANFNFYEVDNVYGNLFFQFPKVLMYGEQYKQLSAEAKLAYMVLKDRLEFSLRNQWIDTENRVYFIFTNQELQTLFNCSEHKVIKIKKELESVNLLFQKKMGFDPVQKKNLPNHLYLAKLEVNATDVYLKDNKLEQTFATSGTAKNAAREETDQALAASGTAKNAARQKQAQSLDTNGTAKSAVYQNKDINTLDTNRYNIDTAELDFSTENYSKTEIQKQNQDLVEQAYKFLTNDEAGIPFEPETVKLISLWTNNPKQVRKFIGIILNARKAVQEEHNISFILDDEPELQAKITQTIRRYFNALRSDDKKIRNQENYLYITMKNMFENYGSARQQREYRAEHPTKKDREEAFINGLKGGLPESIRNAENYK